MIRVVILDDSEIVRLRLEALLETAPDIRVVKKLAAVGNADAPGELSYADVVLLDLWMPGRSGLSALVDLAKRARIVVVSDAPRESDTAREAIARGAVAYVSKRELGAPGGGERLRRVVREAASRRSGGPPTDVLLVAGSTGAHRAIARVIPSLVGTAFVTVVAQHLAEGSDEAFVAWLGSLGVPARLAATGLALEAGALFVAPAGQQTVLDPPSRLRVRPSAGELHAPSADVLLSSAAYLGARLTAVVLSGLGADGARGVAAIARAGARVLVQAPDDDCVARSMPAAALAAAPDARSLSIDAILEELRGQRR